MFDQIDGEAYALGNARRNYANQPENIPNWINVSEWLQFPTTASEEVAKRNVERFAKDRGVSTGDVFAEFKECIAHDAKYLHNPRY